MEGRRGSSSGPRGPKRKNGYTSGRTDRGRGRPGGKRERPDYRERRSSSRSGGPGRGPERRPVKPVTLEEDKWSHLSDEEFRSQMRKLILDSNLMETGFGARRFYFVNRGGRIPFLDISENLAGRLVNGLAAIVDLTSEQQPEYAIVPMAMVEKIKAVDPEMIRFFNTE